MKDYKRKYFYDITDGNYQTIYYIKDNRVFYTFKSSDGKLLTMESWSYEDLKDYELAIEQAELVPLVGR